MTFKVGLFGSLLDSRGEPIFGRAPLDVLDRPGLQWEWIKEDCAEVTPEIAARYDALHVNLQRVTEASVSGRDRRLRIVARNGVGYDTVDVPACTRNGVLVTNTPIAVRRPVAVAALTLVFALAGRLIEKDWLVRTNRWNERNNVMGFGLTTRTLGLIGAGGIGQEIIRLAMPFFGRIIAADPFVDEAGIAALGAELLPFDDVMRQSDFVVACCLLTPETRHLVDARALALMKPTAFFVNVARGAIHDEAALVEALGAGRIAGAGLDVTEVEPIPPDSPLLGLKNTIITPHALCWTDECFGDIATTALTSIVDALDRRRPRHLVDPAAWGGLES
ncbi:MAG: dehydrogenase [Hyphomicrobiaceae bacterium]|nr:dehydrogenase [Hyphomicrobiaceae bacterium]